MGVLDANHAALDAQDAVRDVAQLEHIALETLDREVLVHRADELRLGFQHDAVVGVIGNRSTRGNGRKPCAAAPAQHVIDGIVVKQRAMTAASGRETFREHAHDFVELPAFEITEGMRAAQQGEQSVLIPFASGDFGHDLLRENVERFGGHVELVQLTAAHAVEQCGAFDQIVARQGKQPPLGRAADRVPRAADALQKGCNGAGRSQLADEIDVADVDAELQGCGGDQRPQLTALES